MPENHIDLDNAAAHGGDYVDVTYDILRTLASSWRARLEGVELRIAEGDDDGSMRNFRQGEIEIFNECIRDLERVLDNTHTAQVYKRRAMG